MNTFKIVMLLLFVNLSLIEDGRAQGQTHDFETTKATAASNDADFSPDGTKIATYTKDGYIAIWSVKSGNLLQKIPGQKGYISELDWSPDGKLLASASTNGTIAIWDVASGHLQRTVGDFEPGNTIPYQGTNEVEFSPNGKFIAGMQYVPNGEVVVWNISDGEEIVRIEEDTRFNDIGWSADNSSIYSIDQNGYLSVWSFFKSKLINKVRLDKQRLVDLDATRQSVIATGGKSGKIVLYDTEKKTVKTINQGSFINRVAVTTKFDRVAGAGGDGFLYIYKLSSGELLYKKYAHDSINYYVSFSPDGGLLATTGEDNCVRLWNTITGELVKEIRGQVNF